MPENLTHSLAFFKRASEKKSIYDHFMSRNPNILGTVITTTKDGLKNIKTFLEKKQKNTAECGNYEYTILNDEQHIIRSVIFTGPFNALMLQDNTVTALFIPSGGEQIDMGNSVIIDESTLLEHDFRLFYTIKLVIEGIQNQVDYTRIKVALKSFFDNAYHKEVIAPEQSQKPLDKRAFDIILHERDYENVKSGEYLIRAMLEIVKAELSNNSRRFYTGVSFAKDKTMKTVRFVIESDENKIYTLDSVKSEFYITCRKTLQNITASEAESTTTKIVKQLLLAVDNKIEIQQFFEFLLNLRK
ncbi:hypothetical protein GR140_18790 [Pseudomonas putida]|uniref:hypothetical protein n=1 Tax=Pseudomonas putida TaxID=303 RepID=UPI001BAE96EF|nr:hypothetical protein [Pseudomonas putida]QUG90712.1 hypothetical protein GR140_18790 [Pseudomonas putida]